MHEEVWSTGERAMVSKAAAKGIPISGSLELLPLCNMNCNMCYIRMDRSEMNRLGRLRTVEEWLSIGMEMKRAGVLFLLLTGGEPLLYEGFKEVYLGLQKLGLIISVNTNATLLDEEWICFFAQNRPRRINITLYGASEETYDKLCHYKQGFAKAVNAIKMLKSKQIDVRMNISVTPYNVGELDEILSIAKELDVPAAVDTYMQPLLRERNKPFPMQSRLEPERAAAAQIHRLTRMGTKEEVREYAARKIWETENFIHSDTLRHMTCNGGKASFTINWQGELRPCLIMTEPSENVFEKGFEECWSVVKKGCLGICLNVKCVSCKMRPICRTCAASAKCETGDWDGLPEYLCRHSEEIMRGLQKLAEE